MSNVIKKHSVRFTFEVYLLSIVPVFLLLIENYKAFVEGQDMSFDLVVLVLKDAFVKALIILIDVLLILVIYYNIEYRLKRNKSFLIKTFKDRNAFLSNKQLKIDDELLFIKLLKENRVWNDVRFKMKGKNEFVFDKSLVDFVSINSVFMRHEEDRIPLFIVDDDRLKSEFIDNLVLGNNRYVAFLLRVPELKNKINFALSICRYEDSTFYELDSFSNV